MKTNKPLISISVGPFMILFFIFLVLKLCGIIGWSWWWVFCPLWAIPVFFVGFIVSWMVFIAIVALIELIFRR